MKPSIRRALVTSTTAIAAAGIALAAPASAFAMPEIIQDEGGVIVTFDDVDERTEDAIEYVVEAVDNIARQNSGVVYTNLRGPRSAATWTYDSRLFNNGRPLHMECTQEEDQTPNKGYDCWSVLDD
ncbi:hypothetical protein C8K36_105309 [Rhodococcus sp. OK519]|uniref:hypothetical protein n=1 Tax=Rhodococcus sp. OK519 TaxID=2135729 RepID=UPI000D33F6A8|nr:hypothetical protein C8K36_105309 [Rhodococcus sp. OK519]